MKLLFKQRLFSWFDSYDIYDESGNTVYVVKGQLSWGHKLVIYDAYGNEVGMVVQRVLTFLPKFEIYKNGSYIGCLNKEFSFLTPHYNIDYNGYSIALTGSSRSRNECMHIKALVFQFNNLLCNLSQIENSTQSYSFFRSENTTF